MNNDHGLLWCRAIAFALLFNFAAMYEMAHKGPLSPASFRDGDVAGYLDYTLAAPAGKTFDELYNYEMREESSLQNVLMRSPNGILDVVIGAIARPAHLSPTELALALNLICSAASYYLFSLFFGFFSRASIAECASAALLLLPWAFAPNNILQIAWPWSLPVNGMSFTSHSVVPVLRAVYTQVSYPFSALALLHAARWFSAPKESSRGWFATAAATAALAYIYFFSWASVVTVVGCWGLINCLLSTSAVSEKFYGRDWREIGKALMVHLVLVFPAVVIMKRMSDETAEIGPVTEILRRYWFLPLPNLLALLATLVLCIRRAGSPAIQQLLRLLLACYISEIALMNLQPILGAPLIPFHFSCFYLDPFEAGLIVCIVLTLAFKRLYWQPYLLCCSLVLARSAREWIDIRAIKGTSEAIELAQRLQTTRQEAPVVAMMPFNRPFQVETLETQSRSRPNEFAALSGTSLLYQHWFPQRISLEEKIRRELLLGWIFSGRIALVRSCGFDLAVFDENAWYQNWVLMQLDRQRTCGETRRILDSVTLCNLLREFRVDQVIWERDILPGPHFDTGLFTLEWTSSGGAYQIFRFAQARAIQENCAG